VRSAAGAAAAAAAGRRSGVSCFALPCCYDCQVHLWKVWYSFKSYCDSATGSAGAPAVVEEEEAAHQQSCCCSLFLLVLPWILEELLIITITTTAGKGPIIVEISGRWSAEWIIGVAGVFRRSLWHYNHQIEVDFLFL